MLCGVILLCIYYYIIDLIKYEVYNIRKFKYFNWVFVCYVIIYVIYCGDWK